ncbi:MAG: PEP-utilizing enzyme [Patescibacteria group bacterium]
MNIKFATVLDFKGATWGLLVSRNMSLWHDSLAGQGYYSNNKSFGINAPLRTIALVENSIHTDLMVSYDDYTKYAKEVLDLFVNPENHLQIREKYFSLADKLLGSIEVCKNKLNLESFRNFQEAYKIFSAGLNVTAVFGRISLEVLTDKLRATEYSSEEIAKIIPVITYPTEASPMLQSRVDLLKIAEELKNNTKVNVKKETALLKEWLNKYQHIPVNFCEEPWLLQDAMSQLDEIMDKDCSLELKRIENNSISNIALAIAKLKEINNSEIQAIAKAISEASYINEFRKNAISKASLEYRPIFETIAKKAGSNNWRDCFYLLSGEMEKVLTGEINDLQLLIKQRDLCAILQKKEGPLILSDVDAKLLLSLLRVQPIDQIDDVSKQLSVKGFTACRGTIQGTVKIILSTADFKKMKPGDILVTKATSVDFVPIMQKAGAFVTDEGGITSHASIVSREMNKPCIIGTKISTKVFKDGDFVEVDANHGIVRKIR